MPRSLGRVSSLLWSVLLAPRQGNRPSRSNWQNNSQRAALSRVRPSPAGASVPAAETNSHNTPNKSSELRPPESLSAAGSAPPEPARTVSDRGSPARAQPSYARPPAPPPARGPSGAARPLNPRTAGTPKPPYARARPSPQHPSLRPARPPPPRSGAANQNFYFPFPNFYPNFQDPAPRQPATRRCARAAPDRASGPQREGGLRAGIPALGLPPQRERPLGPAFSTPKGGQTLPGSPPSPPHLAAAAGCVTGLLPLLLRGMERGLGARDGRQGKRDGGMDG
ncbi:nascent polypeptide-associated complex subunit alpha, muscle-specific form-like [Pezoporus occidentalis]|uniref:nascent polypeptide-associated complex subunit alpha, muscle-specific form-like n=1 Tax=Pezoporus occidentalis TaxID=407982 RepID=UPI002F90734A